MGGELLFGDAAELIRNTVQPRDVAEVPYIGLEHIEEGTLRLNSYGSSKNVDSAKFLFREGDILFGKLRPYFRKVIRAPFDGVCSTDIWVVRAKNGVDQGYLYYWMAAEDFVEFATSGSEGTRMPRAKWEHVSRFSRPMLDISEQRAIAHILGTLDDKIELNRQMNRTLEAMAQALFKSWFIDFDPVVVNALRVGNPIPEQFAQRACLCRSFGRQAAHYRDNPGALRLPEDTLRQFPDRFRDSELGPIPEGWTVKSLFELFELIGGGTPKTSVPEYWNGDIPWFSVVDAPNPTDVFVIDTEKRITQLGIEKSSTKILPVGTTIISARGTVGKCALVGVPMAMNQSCYGIQGREGVSDVFTYYTIRLQVSDLQRSGHGSVFNTITRETFKSIKVPFSGTNLTQQFEGFVSNFMDQILHNLFQIDTLAKLRDTLLPKLISGELRLSAAALETLAAQAGVPDAERLLEDVL